MPSDSRDIRERGDAGFTLIEMMVVLVLVALTLGLSLPAWNSRGSAQLRPLTAQLAAELRMARSTAIIQNRPISFVFDPKARVYQVQGVGRPTALPRSVGLTLVTSKELVRDGGSARLVFFPDGSSTGGKLTLFDRKDSMTIHVEWLTGAVVAQRHI